MGQHSGRPGVREYAEDPGSHRITQLQGELGTTDLARHLAFFYRSPQTQLTVAAAFVDHALRTNNRCLYFYDSNTRDDVEASLRSVGIDVAARLEAGDLLLRAGADAYQDAIFDPTELISALEEECHESVSAGYDGLWIAGETSWCFHTEHPYDHVVDFEADFDAACPDLPVTALCQYDLNRFNEESVAKALWTHEQIIYRYTVCENPFYIPPSEYQTGDRQLSNTQLVLEQARKVASTQRLAERREQRLSIVNRILRHNVRNELNVVRGLIDLVRYDESLPSEHQEHLATAASNVDELFDVAEKARYVEWTIEDSDVERSPLGSFVADAREQVESAYPDAAVTVEGDTDLLVLADTALDTALVELFHYAFRIQDPDPPTLSVRLSAPSTETACIDLRFPGGSVPDNDREVLEAGTEQPLKHCDGLGLWIANWIVENSHGRLELPEHGDPQIRLQLYQIAEGDLSD